MNALGRVIGKRASVSASQACGSMSLSLAARPLARDGKLMGEDFLCSRRPAGGNPAPRSAAAGDLGHAIRNAQEGFFTLR